MLLQQLLVLSSALADELLHRLMLPPSKAIAIG
jgi:hypothetical protein